MPTDPLEQRVDALLQKAEERLAELLAEARDTFAAVSGEAPLRAAPVNSVEAALRTRVDGLVTRLDAAEEQITEEIERRFEADDRKAAIERNARLRDRLEERLAAARKSWEQRLDDVVVTGMAVAARRLEALAVAEDPTQRCPRCGGPFDPGRVWQSTNVACPHCGSICTVGPGPARREWYARGIAALADESALPAKRAWDEAQAAFAALRHPVPSDLERLADAHEAYQRARLATMVERHPAWTAEQAEREVQGMRNQLLGYHAAHRAQMARTAEGLAIAGRGDPARVRQWAAQAAASPETRHLLLSDLLEAAAERRLLRAADTLVRVVHADELPWFGRGRWVRARLRELAPAH